MDKSLLECQLYFGKQALGKVRVMLYLTFQHYPNIYLYKVAWACPTLRIGVGFATHILICYILICYATMPNLSSI